jgi:ABC-type multidrug transport system permease subunit
MGEVYPWLIQYRLLVVPANAILLVIFCGMLYTLRKFERKEEWILILNKNKNRIHST